MVSIIVPCYNLAQYLQDTLDSIIVQSYKDWECIIVDDGSSDNTKEVSESYIKKDTRIKYIYQDNQGVSAARNNGVSYSSGEYIFPLDADDVIAPTYIGKAVEYLSNHNDCKLVYCKARFFGKRDQDWVLPEYSYENLKWTNMVFNAALFRKSDFMAIGGYNTNMKKGLEDWDFLLSFLNPNDKVYQIPETLFFYRIRENSRTGYAFKNEVELKRQIYLNHPERYKDDIANIIIFHERIEDLKNIQSSILYKIWSTISNPIKQLIRNSRLKG